uniref:Transmembrane protein 116 n=1 Tax=Astyanax mexicanus TaxID=7994 RepID=A0A3B1K982_ASTMX
MDMLIQNNTQQNTTVPTENWTSILGSGSIIFYALFQKLVRTSEVQPLFLLSLTDMLLAASWLCGALLFTTSCDSYATCYNLHTVEQYMASFFYTLNYVWVLYTGLMEKYNRRLSGLPAQVLPLLLTMPVFITGNVDRCYVNFTQPYCLLLYTGALFLTSSVSDVIPSCKIISDYTITIFLFTFVITFIGIVFQVFMFKARSLYKRFVTSSGFLADRQWATLRVLERRMFLYPAVFFFCWGTILLATLMLFKPEEVKGRMGVILYISQAFTSASQGLLNCIVYGWTQQHFRSLSSSGMRDVDTQTPLLRSQKRTYAALRSS